eukprot:GHVL01009672.1.p1 GENE.GHVL01009672.1~~GHVL01009672.1.p1  ORF type:complete len:299 (+),score=51.57 GHVL01009672.1:226-1122(+)
MGFAVDPISIAAFGWAEAQGCRAEMEDGFTLIDCFGGFDNDSLFSLFDGHGGRDVVEYLCRSFPFAVLRELRKHSSSQIKEALKDAFVNCDNNMMKEGIRTSGATACVIFSHQRQGVSVIYCAHVGDARAVLCRDSVAIRLTSMSDHKATDAHESKRINDMGGSVFNERVNGVLAISRAFGDAILKKPMAPADFVSVCPDLTVTPVKPTDEFLIIACDGVWDVMEDQEAVELIKKDIKMLKMCMKKSEDYIFTRQELAEVSEILARHLVDEALRKGTQDNVSVIILFPNGTAHTFKKY